MSRRLGSRLGAAVLTGAFVLAAGDGAHASLFRHRATPGAQPSPAAASTGRPGMTPNGYATAAPAVPYAPPAAALTSGRRALTLLDAERLAVRNHPDLKLSAFDTRAAAEAIKIAHAGYEPQVLGTAVQAVASGGSRIAAYNAITDPTVIQRTALGVGVTQYITDFGRTGDLVQAAELDTRARAAAFEQTRDLILLSVTQAYFDVLRANALLVVAEQTVTERRELFRIASTLQRAGLRSTLDVAIAARDVASARQLVLTGRNRRLDAYADLTNAIGSSQYAIYRLQDVARLPPAPSDFSRLESEAVATNPVLLQARAEGEAAAERVRATSKLTDPTVTGYGFFGADPVSESNVHVPSPYAVAGINLTLPLFTGGALQAQRRQAQDLASKASEAEVVQRNALVRDIRVAFEDVRTARGNVDVSDTILSTADTALRDTRIRYRIGLSTIADVSEAELEQTQAAIERTNAVYDYVVRDADLEFATGVIAAPVIAGAGIVPGEDAGIDVVPGRSGPGPAPAVRSPRAPSGTGTGGGGGGTGGGGVMGPAASDPASVGSLGAGRGAAALW